MPIRGKDGKYRPLGYKGEPMNQFQYDRWVKENEPPVRTEKKIAPIKKMRAFNRKSDAKGSNYKPGRR